MGGRLFASGLQVCFLADEILSLHLWPGQPGLYRIVFRFQLVAEQSVAFLETRGRTVDADAHGYDA